MMKRYALPVMLILIVLFSLSACRSEPKAIDKTLLSSVGMSRTEAQKTLNLTGDEVYKGQDYTGKNNLHKSFSYAGKSIDTILGFSAEEALIYTQADLVISSCTDADYAYMVKLVTALQAQFGEPTNIGTSLLGGTAAGNEEQFTIAKAEDFFRQLTKCEPQSNIAVQYLGLDKNYGMVNTNFTVQEDNSLCISISTSTKKAFLE